MVFTIADTLLKPALALWAEGLGSDCGVPRAGGYWHLMETTPYDKHAVQYADLWTVTSTIAGVQGAVKRVCRVLSTMILTQSQTPDLKTMRRNFQPV